MGPILGSTKITLDHIRGECDLTVSGGLRHISGNVSPYFSITHTVTQGRREITGGFADGTIVEALPHLADLASMHLSDIDGVPIHAVQNGWYFLCGASSDGNGAKFHAGNSDSPLTARECLRIVADLYRISMDDAVALSNSIECESALARWVEDQKPRFKAEADAMIAKYGLQIFGDAFVSKAA